MTSSVSFCQNLFPVADEATGTEIKDAAQKRLSVILLFNILPLSFKKALWFRILALVLPSLSCSCVSVATPGGWGVAGRGSGLHLFVLLFGRKLHIRQANLHGQDERGVRVAAQWGLVFTCNNTQRRPQN